MHATYARLGRRNVMILIIPAKIEASARSHISSGDQSRLNIHSAHSLYSSVREIKGKKSRLMANFVRSDEIFRVMATCLSFDSG